MLRPANTGDIGLGVAAGCQIDARLIGPFIIDGPTSADFGTASATRVKLPHFLKTPAVIVEGQAVNRRQIVKYVANKLGGVHFDPSRQRKGDEFIRHLESLDGYLVVHPLSVVDVTLLAIIQAMISSSSVMEPFGLIPTAMTLDVPLQSARDEVQIPARSFMRFDLTGDA